MGSRSRHPHEKDSIVPRGACNRYRARPQVAHRRTDDNTIILEDFNAKNTTWGSTITNARGLELSNLVNDKAFLCLKDGTHTFRSNSYGSTDVLDLTFVSAGLFPYSSWRVLDNIGTDHLPILVEVDLKVNCTAVKNLDWNFKKTYWSLFEIISNNLISQEPISDNLEKEWSHVKHSIFTAAKSGIPRGESKQTLTFFAHNSDLIKPLISQRMELLKVITQNGGLDKKSELNKLNAEIIKKIYVQVKRSNWQNLCEKLNCRTSNTKLWKLAKQIHNLKPSNEETNAIISNNGHVSVDAREATEALAQHYANENNPLFNVDFTLPGLTFALQNLDTKKSPGPDSIPGHFLSHLGISGRERLLYICNLSWKTGKLPRQLKSAIVIRIHKPNKNAGLTTCYRPISLTCITCKLMESMVLRRLTHHLHTNNLMPSEQFAFRRDYSTVDQILYFTQ
ncbi:RNA-directed DNA polymerase from mobile element jockey [Trichonephila clavipes]|nr:RNA-directed DNA polymerase from mobile element jockey [Trichonephila clavipes]